VPVAWSDEEGSSFNVLSDGRKVASELWRLHRQVPPAGCRRDRTGVAMATAGGR